jgi:hypothetical protein
MARELKAIYDQAALEKATFSSLDGLLVDSEDNSSTLDNNQRLLNDLTTPSRVANWRLILWVVSFMIWVHETLWDLFLVDVQTQIAAGKPGTTLWYQQEAFLWQNGQELTWNGSKYIYSVVDETLRLVTRCSINDQGGIVRVKVAKGNVTPVQLSATEEASFAAYMNQIKIAGTNLLVINFPADQVRMAWEIFYDPIQTPAIVRANVEAAILDYLANIPFDGKLVLNHLIDYVQQADGVINPVLINCDCNNISSSFAPVVNEYQSVSGYFVISQNNPLSGYYDVPTNLIQVIKMTPYV